MAWPALSPLQPPRWLRNGHAQTLLGHLLGQRPALAWPRPYLAHVFRLRDGDELEAWYRPGERALVHLYHGLGGSADSGCIRRAAQALSEHGFAVLAVHQRGSGSGRARAHLPYMAGRSEDLEDVQQQAAELAPQLPQVLVGFSISGNTVLRLAASAELAPAACIAVNPPIDLDRCSERLLHWPARLYDWRILQACRRWLPHLRGAGPTPRAYSVPKSASLREFDRLYIAPVWGFRSRAEYYAAASAAPLLARIQTPTFVLSSADDPIAPARDLLAAARSPAVHLHVERYGGHLGYLAEDRPLSAPRRWLDDALITCLEGYLGAPTDPAARPRAATTHGHA